MKILLVVFWVYIIVGICSKKDRDVDNDDIDLDIVETRDRSNTRASRYKGILY